MAQRISDQKQPHQLKATTAGRYMSSSDADQLDKRQASLPSL